MAGIIDIEYELPVRKLGNKELAELYTSWEESKIFEKTGILERRIVDENETALDLAVRASKRLMKRNNIGKDEIDCILYITLSPEYIMPASACLLQERLGLDKTVGAFDLKVGCSGFIYALSVAKAYVDSGMFENVLLVASDILSRYIHPLDRSTRTLFGDAATATLVGKRGWQIGSVDLCTNGKDYDAVIVPAGGLKMPISELTSKEYEKDGNILTQENMYMDGSKVFEFVIDEIPQSVCRVLEKEGLKDYEVDMFVFHQANAFMLNYLRKVMKIDKDKFYMNFSDVGNTASSSVVIALKRAWEEGKLENVDTIVLSAFGTGLSWGSVVLKKDKMHVE